MKKGLIKLLAFVFVIAIALTSLVGCAGGKYEMKLGCFEYSDWEGNGNLVYCALLVDEAGKVVLARFDEIAYSGDAPVSKREKGDAYGMAAAGATYEWYEQVENLERSLIGKSKEDVLGTEGAELGSSCTIEISNLIAAAGNAFEMDGGKEVAAHRELVLTLTLSAVKNGDGYITSASAITLYRGFTEAIITEIKK